jgi:hypothetical protein
MRTLGLPRPLSGGHPDALRVAREAYLDWEPLKVLLDLISDSAVRTVGGAPQLVKIHQHGQTESLVWRDSDGNDHFGGRRVQPQERFDRRIIQLKVDEIVTTYSDRSVHSTAGVSREGNADLPAPLNGVC